MATALALNEAEQGSSFLRIADQIRRGATPQLSSGDLETRLQELESQGLRRMLGRGGAAYVRQDKLERIISLAAQDVAANLRDLFVRLQTRGYTSESNLLMLAAVVANVAYQALIAAMPDNASQEYSAKALPHRLSRQICTLDIFEITGHDDAATPLIERLGQLIGGISDVSDRIVSADERLSDELLAEILFENQEEELQRYLENDVGLIAGWLTEAKANLANRDFEELPSAEWPETGGLVPPTHTAVVTHPKDGTFSFSLVDDDRMILAGYLGHGVATRLEAFLNNHKSVTTVGIYSGGGRIAEGYKVRDLIRNRGLQTFVYRECVSAATIAYLGGKLRAISRSDRLGFHKTSVPERDEVAQKDTRDLDQVRQAVALGVAYDFAARAYGGSDTWYPSVGELLQSGFVTHESNPPIFVVLDQEFYEVDQLEHALHAWESGDYACSIQLLRPLGEAGHAFAQCALGIFYRDGKGAAQDHSEAARWFRMAAEQGEPSAQNNLAICYSKGLGVKQDEGAAVSWFRRAARQGEVNAQENLEKRGLKAPW